LQSKVRDRAFLERLFFLSHSRWYLCHPTSLPVKFYNN
jgi:hypothetical protein